MTTDRVMLECWLGMAHRVGYDMCSVHYTIQIGAFDEAVLRRMETANWRV